MTIDVGAMLAREAYNKLTPKQRAKGLRILYRNRSTLNSFNTGTPGDCSFKPEEKDSNYEDQSKSYSN